MSYLVVAQVTVKGAFVKLSTKAVRSMFVKLESLITFSLCQNFPLTGTRDQCCVFVFVTFILFKIDYA